MYNFLNTNLFGLRAVSVEHYFLDRMNTNCFYLNDISTSFFTFDHLCGKQMLHVRVVDIEGLAKLVCYVILYYIGFAVDLWHL